MPLTVVLFTISSISAVLKPALYAKLLSFDIINLVFVPMEFVSNKFAICSSPSKDNEK